MKEILRYQANDGAIFTTKEAAVERDALIAAVEQAMAPLGHILTFDQGNKGWIQLDTNKVREAKCAILKLSRSIFEKSYPEIIKAIDTDPDSVHPRSIVARILDEHGGPLDKAWHRFGCIDKLGREFNQPYYAMHGPNPGQVCVEDRR